MFKRFAPLVCAALLAALLFSLPAAATPAEPQLCYPTGGVAEYTLTEVPANGVFVAIGHSPATAFLNHAVDMDGDGYILVDGASTRTSVPGVFAAGDAVDRVYRQAISAAGMGCRAALDAQAYLNDNQ